MLATWPSNNEDRAQDLMYEAMDVHGRDPRKAY